MISGDNRSLKQQLDQKESQCLRISNLYDKMMNDLAQKDSLVSSLHMQLERLGHSEISMSREAINNHGNEG